MVNIVGVRTLVPPTVGGPPITETKMTARAILQCRPNSHPFPVSIESLIVLKDSAAFGVHKGSVPVLFCVGNEAESPPIGGQDGNLHVLREFLGRNLDVGVFLF